MPKIFSRLATRGATYIKRFIIIKINSTALFVNNKTYIKMSNYFITLNPWLDIQQPFKISLQWKCYTNSSFLGKSFVFTHHTESCQTSKMNLFAKIVNRPHLYFFFQKALSYMFDRLLNSMWNSIWWNIFFSDDVAVRLYELF